MAIRLFTKRVDLVDKRISKFKLFANTLFWPSGKPSKLSPQAKLDLKKVVSPYLQTLDSNTTPGQDPSFDPSRTIRHIDTTFEHFFYQRPYTLKNFNFYLQALAQQYKPEEAYVTLEKM